MIDTFRLGACASLGISDLSSWEFPLAFHWERPFRNFAWDRSLLRLPRLGSFLLVSFACELSRGMVRLILIAFELSLGICRLASFLGGSWLAMSRLFCFAWDVWFGSFRSEALAWKLSLGSFRLGPGSGGILFQRQGNLLVGLGC